MNSAITLVDDRPYFVRALLHGLDQKILTQEHLKAMATDGAKGIVQIADHFGTAYLRTDLESARTRLVNLASLYLEDFSNGDLTAAALSLRDNTFLSHSRGGSEMLKRLHAMPVDTGLYPRTADPAGQKLFLNERSFAFPMNRASYRAQVATCQANQLRVDFAHWLARQLNARREDYEDSSAEELIRSAMLVLCVSSTTRELPSKAQFIGYIETLRKKSFKPVRTALESLTRDAPEAFAQLAEQSMQAFVEDTLPALRASKKTADELLHTDSQGSFLVREALEADIVAYDRLVAREWVRVTQGNADDPNVLATIFLFIATGHAPKAKALLKEAKTVIGTFREKGFDSQAVLDYIDSQAPFEQRMDLKALWLEDLRPEAETHLADKDPQMPDTHMDRALRYFRQTCVATWKDRSR